MYYHRSSAPVFTHRHRHVLLRAHPPQKNKVSSNNQSSKSLQNPYKQNAQASPASSSSTKSKQHKSPPNTFNHHKSRISRIAVSNSEEKTSIKSYPSKQQQQQESTTTNQTLGQRIQEFTSFASPHLLLSTTSTYIWLPTDSNLPSHVIQQRIHHDKRRRNASLLLDKLGCDCIHSNHFICKDELLCRVILAAALPYRSTTNSPNTASSTSNTTVVSSFYPQDMAVIHSSLRGLHSLIGKITTATAADVITEQQTYSSSTSFFFHPQMLYGIQLLIQQAENVANYWTLQQAVEIRWAIRGILIRILETSFIDGKYILEQMLPVDDNDHKKKNILQHSTIEKKGLLLALCIPKLEKRVSKLPFDILPCGIHWDIITKESTFQDQQQSYHHHSKNKKKDNESSSQHSTMNSKPLTASLDINNNNTLIQLQNQIDFRFDNIITLSGNSVVERRGTAWVTEEGIGALAYSGKLMESKRLPLIVRTTMRHVEDAIFQQYYYSSQDDDDDEDPTFIAGQVCWEEMGTFFDCALCNLYPTGQSACKFHTDPEHGTYWDRLTCVVSGTGIHISFIWIIVFISLIIHQILLFIQAGEERKFAFRPIPGMSTWSQWDAVKEEVEFLKGTASSNKIIKPDEEWNPTWNSDKEFIPAWIHLFPGDIVLMKGPCNDMFHHSVYPASSSTEEGSVRVSLVLKRALDRHGRRGHGKAS